MYTFSYNKFAKKFITCDKTDAFASKQLSKKAKYLQKSFFYKMGICFCSKSCIGTVRIANRKNNTQCILEFIR